MRNLNNTFLNHRKELPMKVIQFGEGNFLRGFVDWVVDILNEKTSFDGGVYVIQPLKNGLVDLLNEQDGLYHVWLNGISHGKEVDTKRLITSVIGGLNPYEDYESFLKLGESKELEFIFSNTTEAGIAFDPGDESIEKLPSGFPGKVTALLYRRYKHFNGDVNKGLIIIPCELINKNGEALREKIIQYANHFALEDAFIQWINEANTFCNTLVDRIVPGYPKDSIEEVNKELDVKDRLVVNAEPFHLWVIEGPEKVRKHFPAEEAGLQVKFVNDQMPYRTRKVRILNGAHTSIVPLGCLNGLTTVEDVVDDPEMNKFLRDTVFDEIIPTLDLPAEELENFAKDVIERFKNPFIRHELMTISLNSISKFKVRVLPSLLAYVEKFGKLPENLTKALAALLVFYRGHYNGKEIKLKDSDEVISFFKDAWSEGETETTVSNILSNQQLWDTDLTKLDGLKEKVVENVQSLLEKDYKNVNK